MRQQLRRKVATNNEERGQRKNHKEDNQTIRWKEAKSNREEEDKQPTTRQSTKRWNQPLNKATTRSTSPETVQTSWMYTRMLVGKEK